MDWRHWAWNWYHSHHQQQHRHHHLKLVSSSSIGLAVIINAVFIFLKHHHHSLIRKDLGARSVKLLSLSSTFSSPSSPSSPSPSSPSSLSSSPPSSSSSFPIPHHCLIRKELEHGPWNWRGRRFPGLSQHKVLADDGDDEEKRRKCLKFLFPHLLFENDQYHRSNSL